MTRGLRRLCILSATRLDRGDDMDGGDNVIKGTGYSTVLVNTAELRGIGQGTYRNPASCILRTVAGRVIHYVDNGQPFMPLEVSAAAAIAERVRDVGNNRTVDIDDAIEPTAPFVIWPGQTVVFPATFPQLFLRACAGAYGPDDSQATGVGYQSWTTKSGTGWASSAASGLGMGPLDWTIILTVADDLQVMQAQHKARSLVLPVLFDKGNTEGVVYGYDNNFTSAPAGAELLTPASLVGQAALAEYSRATLCLYYLSNNNNLTVDQRPLRLGFLLGALQGFTLPVGVEHSSGSCFLRLNLGKPDRLRAPGNQRFGTLIGTRGNANNGRILAWVECDDGKPDLMKVETYYCAIRSASIALTNPSAIALWGPGHALNPAQRMIWRLRTSSVVAPGVTPQSFAISDVLSPPAVIEATASYAADSQIAYTTTVISYAASATGQHYIRSMQGVDGWGIYSANVGASLTITDAELSLQ